MSRTIAEHMNTELKKSQTHFSCEIFSFLKIPTTKFGTTIDEIFTQYFHNVQSQNYIFFFSIRKLIITIIPQKLQNDRTEIQAISL